MPSTTKPSPLTQYSIPREIHTLIQALQTSFTTTHSGILDIYTIIQKLDILTVRLERINEVNDVLGGEIRSCRCENEKEVELMGKKMRVMERQKDNVELEMKRVKGLWDERMRWVERGAVMHGMKSWEGWMLDGDRKG